MRWRVETVHFHLSRTAIAKQPSSSWCGTSASYSLLASPVLSRALALRPH